MQARVGLANAVAIAESALNLPEIRTSFEAVPAEQRVIVTDELLHSVRSEEHTSELQSH